MNISIFQLISEMELKGEPFAVCTIVDSRGSTPRRTGSKMIVKPNGEIVGSVGGGEVEERVRQEALKSLSDNRTKMVSYQLADPQKGDPGVCGGELEIFIEPVCQDPKIVIVGMGHVGKAVAHLAQWAGYRVAVADDRPEMKANMDIDQAEIWAGPIEQIPERIKISENSCIVLTTRNAELDIENLPALLATPAAYVGVIGSKRRWAITREALEKKGVSTDNINRVHHPIGLEIGAETPEEIAISILAEIIQIRRNKEGKKHIR